MTSSSMSDVTIGLLAQKVMHMKMSVLKDRSNSTPESPVFLNIKLFPGEKFIFVDSLTFSFK
jgi:hypothetical protein